MRDTQKQLAALTEEQRQELLERTLLQRTKPKRFALSFAQQRLWVLEQMAGGAAAYNVPSALRLRGELDLGVLERCFNEVIRRHESLRTAFEVDPATGAPQQVAQAEAAFHMEVVDLTGCPDEERIKRARSLANLEAQKPFDLSRLPLMRASLIRLASGDQVPLLTIHHIISDMWSTEVLTGELTALYNAFLRGKATPLPDLPIQYADFAHWQRNRMQGQVLEDQLAYWRDRLAGRLPVLDLPTRGPRPARHTFNGAEKTWRLGSETILKLKRLSQREGATLFMMLLAAFKTLLYRYTAQTDLLIGVPIANRNRAEVEGLIGLFVNTIILRTDLSDDPTFLQLLARVREAAALKPWVSRHGYDLPRLVNMYGITETTVHVTYRPLVEDDVVKNAGSFIGAPIPDLRLYLLDRRAERAPLQVAGEMFVGGAGVSRGYLNRPELTAAAFVPDLFSVRPGARLYRTGDAGSRLPSGDIRYLGRIDQQVKIRGFRIELGEIEENLIAHEKVRDAVAVARDSGSGEKQLVAYVVPCSGQAPSVAELRGSLEQKLPSYMLPAHFVMLDKFPSCIPKPGEVGPADGSGFQPVCADKPALLGRLQPGCRFIRRSAGADCECGQLERRATPLRRRLLCEGIVVNGFRSASRPCLLRPALSGGAQASVGRMERDRGRVSDAWLYRPGVRGSGRTDPGRHGGRLRIRAVDLLRAQSTGEPSGSASTVTRG